MSHDCFGNPTPGLPPSISDTYADIQEFKSIPFAQRLEYHYARTDAMIGRAPAKRAWELLATMRATLRAGTTPAEQR